MRELLTLVPDAMRDVRPVLARMWWIAAIAAILAGLAVGMLPSDASGIAEKGLAFVLLTTVVSFAVLFAALRNDDPSYRATIGRLGRLIVLSLVIVLALVAIAIGAQLLLGWLPLPLSVLRPLVLAVILVLAAWVETKTLFIYFVAHKNDSPFAYSFATTRGRAFMPTLALIVVGFALDAIIGMINTTAWGAVIGILFAAVVAAFFTPLALRWMRVAERLSANTAPS